MIKYTLRKSTHNTIFFIFGLLLTCTNTTLLHASAFDEMHDQKYMLRLEKAAKEDSDKTNYWEKKGYNSKGDIPKKSEVDNLNEQNSELLREVTEKTKLLDSLQKELISNGWLNEEEDQHTMGGIKLPSKGEVTEQTELLEDTQQILRAAQISDNGHIIGHKQRKVMLGLLYHLFYPKEEDLKLVFSKNDISGLIKKLRIEFKEPSAGEENIALGEEE